MPIVFCASLVPCECAIQAALKICNLPKTEWTAAGDVIIGTTTFGQSPLFHFNTDQFPRAVASAAPQSPPISAWLELDGKPTHQVVIFQAKAAMSAHSTVAMVTKLVSTKPFPMVEATAPPKRAPVKLKIAAITIACRGVSTLVETTVAMALAAS